MGKQSKRVKPKGKTTASASTSTATPTPTDIEHRILQTRAAFKDAVDMAGRTNGVQAVKSLDAFAEKNKDLGLANFAAASMVTKEAFKNIRGPEKLTQIRRAMNYARKSTMCNPNSLVFSSYYTSILQHIPDAYFDLVEECERALDLNEAEADNPVDDLLDESEKKDYGALGKAVAIRALKTLQSNRLNMAKMIEPEPGLSVLNVWEPKTAGVWVRESIDHFLRFKKKLLQVPIPVLRDFSDGLGVLSKHFVEEALTFLELNHQFCFFTCCKCASRFVDLSAYRAHIEIHYPISQTNVELIGTLWADRIKGCEWKAIDMVKSMKRWNVADSKFDFTRENWLGCDDMERQNLISEIEAAFRKLIALQFLTKGNIETIKTYTSNVMQRLSRGGLDTSTNNLDSVLLSLCLLGSSDLRNILKLLNGLVKVADSFDVLNEEPAVDYTFGALNPTLGYVDLQLDGNLIKYVSVHDDICTTFATPPVKDIIVSWVQLREDLANVGDSLLKRLDEKMEIHLELTESQKENAILKKKLKKKLTQWSEEKYKRRCSAPHKLNTFASLLGDEPQFLSLLATAKTMAKSVSTEKACEGDFLESTIELVLLKEINMLVYELNVCNAKLIKVNLELKQIFASLERVSEGDFRPLLIPILKSYFLARIDHLEDRPEEEGSDEEVHEEEEEEVIVWRGRGKEGASQE